MRTVGARAIGVVDRGKPAVDLEARIGLSDALPDALLDGVNATGERNRYVGTGHVERLVTRVDQLAHDQHLDSVVCKTQAIKKQAIQQICHGKSRSARKHAVVISRICELGGHQ